MKLTPTDYSSLEVDMSAAGWMMGIAILLFFLGILITLSWSFAYGSFMITIGLFFLILSLVLYVYVIAKTNLLKVDILVEDETEDKEKASP